VLQTAGARIEELPLVHPNHLGVVFDLLEQLGAVDTFSDAMR